MDTPVQNVPVAAIQSIVRLFDSILDSERQRFNITALPAGIGIFDYDYETHAVTICYSGQTYKVSIINNKPVVEVAHDSIN
jgi:hypothetical protein